MNSRFSLPRSPHRSSIRKITKEVSSRYWHTIRVNENTLVSFGLSIEVDGEPKSRPKQQWLDMIDGALLASPFTQIWPITKRYGYGHY